MPRREAWNYFIFMATWWRSRNVQKVWAGRNWTLTTVKQLAADIRKQAVGRRECTVATILRISWFSVPCLVVYWFLGFLVSKVHRCKVSNFQSVLIDVDPMLPHFKLIFWKILFPSSRLFKRYNTMIWEDIDFIFKVFKKSKDGSLCFPNMFETARLFQHVRNCWFSTLWDL